MGVSAARAVEVNMLTPSAVKASARARRITFSLFAMLFVIFIPPLFGLLPRYTPGGTGRRGRAPLRRLFPHGAETDAAVLPKKFDFAAAPPNGAFGNCYYIFSTKTADCQ